MTRTQRHLALAAGVAAVGFLGMVFLPGSGLRGRLSLTSAYVGLALLAVTLILGPLNLLRRRPNPVNTALRRDVGIWAGLASLFHVAVGLTVHMRGRPWLYFVDQRGSLRLDRFGFANDTGLVAGLLLLLVLVVSNDRALRGLGLRRWKAVQRCCYVVFGLTMAHGAVYQFIEKRPLAFVLVFTALGATAVVFQLCGLVTRWSISSTAATARSSTGAV